MHKFQQDFLQAILKGESSQELMDVILPVGTLTSEGVMHVYRSDYEARMLEALGKSYETTWLLVGDEEFFQLAKSYIKSHPSHFKNLSAYGNDFPRHLASLEVDEDVIRMAEFEKNFWRIFHLPPKKPGVIKPEDLDHIEFNLTESLYLSHSNLKLHDLWLVRESPPEGMSLDDYMGEEYLALYRSEEKVMVRKISAIQHEVIRLIESERRLTRVFEALENHKSPPTPEEWAGVFDVLTFLKT